MTSLAQGHLFIPCMNDDGTMKPLADAEGFLPILEQSPLENIESRLHGYIDDNWQKQPILLGYSDRWAERAVGTSTGAGATNSTTIPVPAGYVHILNAWTIVHTDTAARSVFLALAVGGVNVYLYKSDSLAPYTYIYDAAQVVLKEGDVLQFTVWGLVTDKTAVIDVWGIKVAIGQ